MAIKLKWHTEKRKVADLKVLENNPRIITKEGYEKLKAKIIKLGFHDSLKIDLSNNILSGNQRKRILVELKWDEIECKIPNRELTQEEKNEVILASNIADGAWNWDELTNYPEETLKDVGFNPKEMSIITGEYTPVETDSDELSGEYSQKIGKVIYEPKETNHKISDLFQSENKFNEDIKKIQNKELRKMLKARVAYFSNFNFSKIADYYAYQATLEEQRIMEKLALVLLDKDQLVEHGFSKLLNSISDEESFKK